MKIKKILALLLVFMMVFSSTLPAFASEKNNLKEEVVYGMLKDDGSMDDIHVVNIFDKEGKIVDYGDYTSLRNMKSKDKIGMDDGKITVNNSRDKLYYEGVLEEGELPWNIDIKYSIDDKEYKAEDIAGKSGDLKIDMKIEENKSADDFFYKNYGIQAKVVLDTQKAKNIKAEDATIANVGENKELNYTILPGKDADILVKAEVEDFEMDAISINGINLNLDIDVDDKELIERAEELSSKVNELNQGAKDVKDGTQNLKEGTDKLDDGAQSLKDGTVDLDNGASSLKNGIDEINDALWELNSKSSNLAKGSSEIKAALNKVRDNLSDFSVDTDKIKELSNASSNLKEAIDELNYNLGLLDENVGYDNYKAEAKDKGLDIDEIKAGNEKAISTLNILLEKLNVVTNKAEEYSDIPEIEFLIGELNNQISNISDIEDLFIGNNAAIDGTEIYLNEVSDSISKIYKSSSDLNESYKKFDKAITEFVETLNNMLVKLTELKNAIDTLAERYSEFDSGVNNYTDGLEKIVSGYQEIVDGASSLNSGSLLLKKGSLRLYNNMSNLSNGTSNLYDGTEDLAEGTRKFKDKTSNLDEKVENEIDETLAELTGDTDKTISFVSDENTNVKSVQFIMKTNDIKVEDDSDKASKEDTKELSFWEKFKNLFKFKSKSKN